MQKNCMNICLNILFLDTVMSPQKQVTRVSLILKDGNIKSENLSLLIRLSVSDGPKRDSSNVVSFIGI